MRPTLEGDMPTASAIVTRLQCVALGGVSCTVFARIFRRVSRGTGGTREGRVLSRLSPGTPSARYRSCQRQTVGFDMPVRRMIRAVPSPSAIARTISARQTTLRAVVRLVSRA
jgi:hypothetical protein